MSLSADSGATDDMQRARWPFWLAGGLLLALYAPVVAEAAHIWFTDEYSAHGVFVPFMAALLLYWKRGELARAERRPQLWGLALLLPGLLLEMVSWYAQIRFFAMLSLVPTLLGLTLLLAGNEVTRLLRFPILFLAFAAPLPFWLVQPVSFPIQNLSASAATWLVQELGVPVEKEGFTVGLPNGTSVEVAEECSGFKKTVTISVLACFYASLFALPFWKQGVLTLAAAPAAALANIIRVAGLILTGAQWGEAGIHRVHDFADPLVIVLCLLFLVQLGKALGCKNIRYMA